MFNASNQFQSSTFSTACGLTTRSWDQGEDYNPTNDDVRALYLSESDVRGNLVKTIDPIGGVTSYEYNPRDQLIKLTDVANNETTYEYAAWSLQPTKLVDPDLGTIKYSYDRHNRVRQQSDGRGDAESQIWVNYDKSDRPTQLWHSTKLMSQWTYDSAPNGKGSLAKSEHWNHQASDNASQGLVTKEYSYNSRSLVSQETWTIPGNGTKSISYTYRDSGQPWAVTYPQGWTSQDYNQAGQPDFLQLPGNVHAARWINYNADGQIANLNRGNINTAGQLDTEYTYDGPTGRVKTASHRKQFGTEEYKLAYDWSLSGNLDSVSESTPATQKQCFQYDKLDRLTKAATRSGGNCVYTTDNAAPDPFGLSYGYMPSGNLLSASGAGTVNGSYGYSSKPNAAITAGSRSYTYDGAGNMKSRTDGATENLEYSVTGQMLAITDNANPANTKSSFLYDAEGMRVRRVDPVSTTYYLGDTYEIEITGATTANRIRLEIAGQTVGSYENGALTTRASDHVGSGSLTRNSSGNQTLQRYQPYGQIRGGGSNSLPTDWTFTGQTEDPGTGLQYFKARYYDAELSRFIQADTVVPNPTMSQDFNRYTYVRNNPLKYTDPEGHCPAHLANSPACSEYDYAERNNISWGAWLPEAGNLFNPVTESAGELFVGGMRILIADERNCIGAEAGVGSCSTEIFWASLGRIFRVVKWADEAAGLGRYGDEVAEIAGRKTGTVWDDVIATEQKYPGTEVPRSFRLKLEDGVEVWIHPNATEHLAERVTRSGALGPINTQSQIRSLQAAVRQAGREGISLGKKVNVGGWELQFGFRQSDELVVVNHALYTG